MKILRLILGPFIILALFLSASGRVIAEFKEEAGSIKGAVLPPDAGVKAIAVSKTDTVASIIQDGNFAITGLKPGTYNILIETKPPYMDTGVKDITVKDGESVDVGIIKLMN